MCVLELFCVFVGLKRVRRSRILCYGVWSGFVLFGMCVVLIMCLSVMCVNCCVSMYGVLFV